MSLLQILGWKWYFLLQLIILSAGYYIVNRFKIFKKCSNPAPLIQVGHTLSAHQLDRILALIPTSQWDFFHEVLLNSLRMLHRTLASIELGQDSHGIRITLFDKQFDSVCYAFKRLAQIPTLYSTGQASKGRDIAVTAFVFYRTFYAGIIEKLSAEGQSTYHEEDPYVLLKRMPPQLSLYLGAQSWRMFELKSIIYSDLNQLELNRDIAEFIAVGCQDGPRVDEKNESSVVENHPASDDFEEERELSQGGKKERRQLVGIIDQEKQEEQKEQKEPKKQNTEIEEKGGIQQMVQDQPTDAVVAKNFVEWLQSKISYPNSLYCLNEGGLIFSESLKYGKESVFVSYSLFENYQAESEVHPTRLQSALRQEGYSDDKNYFINGDQLESTNEQKAFRLQVFRLKGIPISQEAIFTIAIYEESDDGN